MMSKYTRRATPSLMGTAMASAVAAAVLLAACSGEKKSDSLAQDSTLNSDMQLAGKGDTAAQPQLNDVPKTTTPAPSTSSSSSRPRRTPRPSSTSTTPSVATTPSGNTVTRTPGASERPLGTIAAGSTLNLTSNAQVCTNTNKVGDRITGTVSSAVTGSNGAVIPAGATVALEITALKRSENMNDKIQMSFQPISVSFGGNTYPINGSVTSAQVNRVRNESTGKDVQKVAIGTAAGAVLGHILGKSTKGTVIGGAVGAAAGAGTAAATANYEGCVPESGKITVSLNSSMQVHS